MTVEEINDLSVGDKIKNTNTENIFEIIEILDDRGEYLLRHTETGKEHGPVFDSWFAVKEWQVA